MQLLDLANDLFARAFSQATRSLRLRLAGRAGGLFNDVLIPQRLDLTQAVCDGLTLHLTCLANRADLPLKELLGLPIEVQLVTDQGTLQRHCAVVTEVRQGQSDGSTTTVQLTACDMFAVMEGRRSNRVFLNKSVTQILRTVLDGWRQRFPAVAHAFDYVLQDIDEARYPSRAFTFQANQSDADFVRGLLKRHGIAWFFRAGPDLAEDVPAQQLVLFDDGSRLSENAAGPVRYHRLDGTEARDTVHLLAPAHTLSTSAVTRSSYDHESARVDVTRESGMVDQGERGNALAAALEDTRIQLPHAGDSWDDHQRLTRLDMQRHEFRAQCLHGRGGVRAQRVGEWNRIEGHALLDMRAEPDREFITIRLELWAENNLPKDLSDRTQALLTASASHVAGWFRPASGDTPREEAGASHRFQNRFLAVQRNVPIVPWWDPETDQPRMPLMTAVVVGPEGQPVWCDELGRVKVRILGLDPAEHDHAQGAGVNGNDGDSAWVRVDTLWAGEGFGVIFPLRAGMEVSLGFDQGDSSRPVITGSRFNFRNGPPRFDHLGGLPYNHALSGIVTRELRGERQQQLRFNDTPGNISVQLASDHGVTQLNIGALSTPMTEGKTEPRGEGFELRTDKSGALRSAQMLLVSVWERLQAGGQQLSAEEHQALLKDQLDLFKSLGDYAAQHQGLATDSAPQAQLQSDVQAGTSPTLNLTAAAGVTTTTPKTLLQYAGVNIDSVSLQHHQQASGGRYVVNAGQGASFFAHEGGIRQIAHHGKLLLQSQADDTQVDSAKNIQLTAAGGKLVGMAHDEITFVTAGGAYLKLSGGQVEIGGPGSLQVKTNGHQWDGPASMSADLPSFGEGDLGRTPRLIRPTDGSPVEGVKLRIEQPDAATLSGSTGSDGRGPKVQTSKFQRLKSIFFVPRQ